MNDGVRDLIDGHWKQLESQKVSGERQVRLSELPVDTDEGRLAAAVDHEGYRHILVPIASHQSVRRSLNGPVLVLRKRPLEGMDSYQVYADLGCLRPDLHDLFTMLCADVLRTIGGLPHSPLKALYRVLDRWKELFRVQGAPLGTEQLAGLFGELTVLTRLLEIDSSAHRLWRGPRGHHHDFSALYDAVEVKASIGGEDRRVRIHGLEQLQPPVDGSLQLAWYDLRRTSEQGEGLLELIERALRLCDDESALLGLLAAIGFRSFDAAFYQDVRFLIIEERWYEVDASFPKLISNDLAKAGIPISVTDVNYTIDLSTEPPSLLEPTRVSEHLSSMIREAT
ncbi:PD-(D/E)XK motif protein [Nonomuraea sp. ZG12]|uniref:PD-(D/E)XK motif protein n=1 Tax=Nonomuraea sp. ZG12 TaxID=3452207 RepID=UPI003F8A49CD